MGCKQSKPAVLQATIHEGKDGPASINKKNQPTGGGANEDGIEASAAAASRRSRLNGSNLTRLAQKLQKDANSGNPAQQQGDEGDTDGSTAPPTPERLAEEELAQPNTVPPMDNDDEDEEDNGPIIPAAVAALSQDSLAAAADGLINVISKSFSMKEDTTAPKKEEANHGDNSLLNVLSRSFSMRETESTPKSTPVRHKKPSSTETPTSPETVNEQDGEDDDDDGKSYKSATSRRSIRFRDEEEGAAEEKKEPDEKERPTTPSLLSAIQRSFSLRENDNDGKKGQQRQQNKTHKTSTPKRNGVKPSPARKKKTGPAMTASNFRQALQSPNNTKRLSNFVLLPPVMEDADDDDVDQLYTPEHAFLLHRHADSHVHWDMMVPLTQLMKTLYGHEYFLDCDSASSSSSVETWEGSSQANIVCRSLWNCPVIAIVLSPTFHESEWCLKQLYTALYRQKQQPNAVTLHIIYSQGMDAAKCQTLKEYQGLDLLSSGNTGATVFKTGTSLQDFALNQLQPTLLQLIQEQQKKNPVKTTLATTSELKSKEQALATWREHCRFRYCLPQKVSYFIGRWTERVQLTATMQKSHAAVLVPETRQYHSGMGKSQLAIQWAHANLATYHIIVWLGADTPDTLMRELVQFGQDMGVLKVNETLHQKKEDALEILARRTLNAIEQKSTPDRPSLLVLDNAPSFEAIKKWMPRQSRNCHAIVTTKDGQGSSQACQVPVGPLDKESSFQVVQHFLSEWGRPSHSDEREAIVEALESFDHLPLATVSFASFLQVLGFDDAFQCLNDCLTDLESDHVYESDCRQSVWAALRAQVVGLDPRSQSVLDYLSVMNAEKVPASVVKTLVANPSEYKLAIKQLQDRALVQVDPISGNLTTCRLLQFNVRERARKDGRLGGILALVGNVLNKAVNDGIRLNGVHSHSVDKFVPHLQALVNVEWPEATPLLGNLMHTLGVVFDSGAEYDDAIQAYKAALTIRKALLGNDHPDCAQTRNSMGLAMSNQGMYERALAVLNEDLNLTKARMGDESVQCSAVLDNIGMVHQENGKHDLALETYAMSLHISKVGLGRTHPSVAKTMNNIGMVQQRKGQYVKALDMFTAALPIAKSTLGEDHAEVASILQNMGIANKNLEKYSEALKMYALVYDIKVKMYGENHPEIGKLASLKGTVYKNQGRYEDALQMYQEDLRIVKSTFGDDHPLVGKILSNVGIVYDIQLKFVMAMDAFASALRIAKAAYGDVHPEVAQLFSSIGLLHESQGQYGKALDTYYRAMDIYDATVPEDDPSALQTEANINKCKDIIFGKDEEADAACNTTSCNIATPNETSCNPWAAFTPDACGFTLAAGGDDED